MHPESTASLGPAAGRRGRSGKYTPGADNLSSRSPASLGAGAGGRLVQGCLHPWAAAPVTGSFGWTVRYQQVGGALQQRAIDPVSGLTGDRRLRILPARFAKAHAARFITFEVVHFPGVLVEPVGLSFAYHDDFIAIPPATRAAHQQSKQGYNSNPHADSS